MIEIFTDGGCHGNPGPGAWAALLRYKGVTKEISGYAPNTTNNRMEIQATIEALKCVSKPGKIDLYTDSQYVQKGATEWLAGWVVRGWKTASKQPVKNQDLWQELYTLTQKMDITWHWVRGHDGHVENEHVDGLVQQVLAAHGV